MADSNAEFPTTIGADAVFKGELHFEKGVQLLGRFEGQIKTEGQLLIAEGATLQGDIQAGTIRVDGKISGNVVADAKVQLTASARVEGDVQAARLEVAEGATLVGRCTIGVNGKTAQAAGPIKSASTDVLTPAKGKVPEVIPAKR
jgi:cytoskeletal protein CcmA (bactofilin family)